jgi:hypothetical protein
LSTTELSDGMWVRGKLMARIPDPDTGRWFTQNLDPVDRGLTDKPQVSVEGLVNAIHPTQQWMEVQGWRVSLVSPACTTCAGHTVGEAVRVVGELKAGLITAHEVVSRP